MLDVCSESLRLTLSHSQTTLLNLIGTIDDPTTGTIELFSERVDASSSDKFLSDLRLRKIGFVFQSFNLLSTLSAYDNVLLPMTVLGKLSAKEAKKKALLLLDSSCCNTLSLDSFLIIARFLHTRSGWTQRSRWTSAI